MVVATVMMVILRMVVLTMTVMLMLAIWPWQWYPCNGRMVMVVVLTCW